MFGWKKARRQRSSNRQLRQERRVMGIKKGDLIDERKRHPQSCGLVVKVMGGGEGFEKIVCCEHELTAEDVVPSVAVAKGRKRGQMPAAIVLDEKKLYPDSCGLRVMIMDG